MAIFSYSDIEIIGMNACVPNNSISNMEYSSFFSLEEARKVVKMTGIESRRSAKVGIAASDLAYTAAYNLLNDMDIAPESIDGIVFCSVTPDYRMPATSFVLQDRLGVRKNAVCFDVNMGCGGFVFSLNLIYSMMASQQLQRVLLLNAHVITKNMSHKDKATSLLFGDGATATLVARNETNANKNQTYFSSMTDGSGFEFIIRPGGGYRNPSSIDTLTSKKREDGSYRTDEDLSMDGPAIFDFTITKVPADIQKILRISSTTIDVIDSFVFHQANLFIIKHIAKKLKVPMDRVPISLDRYGNLSSASIPLTIVSELKDKLQNQRSKLLLCGFGVGLAWGSVILDLNNPYIGKVIEE